MFEKRVHQRSPIELAASFGIPEAADIIRVATVINISKSGFCFYSDKAVRPKTRISLTIESEDQEKISINVQAVWSKKIEKTGKYMIGVSIADSSGPSFDRFLDFYNDLLKKQDEEIN